MSSTSRSTLIVAAIIAISLLAGCFQIKAPETIDVDWGNGRAHAGDRPKGTESERNAALMDENARLRKRVSQLDDRLEDADEQIEDLQEDLRDTKRDLDRARGGRRRDDDDDDD